MKQVLLTVAALLSLTYGQAQVTYQQNFDGNHNDILNQGWQFLTISGAPQNNGVYSTSSSIQAIGIIGGSAGMATFNIVNQIPSHIANLDCVIVSPPIAVAGGESFLNYKTGSVRIGANGNSHYSVYIITKTEMDNVTNTAQLKTLLNSKTAEDEATISNESVGNGMSLDDYDGKRVHFIFRLHNSPTNTIFLVDEFKVTGGTLNNHEAEKLQLAAYPNPVNNLLTINYEAIEEISFTDTNGRSVYNKNYNAQDTVLVDVSQLSQGIYIMSVKTAYGISTKKVIKS